MALAAARGLDLQEYVQLLLEEFVPMRDTTKLSREERAQAWRESVLGLPRTAPLSDEAISRESLYAVRG